MTFNKPVKRFLKRLLPYMPEPLLLAAIRRRPWLLDRVPAGRSIRWPYYQGDLTVWIDPANDIERCMLTGYDYGVVQSVQRFVGPGRAVWTWVQTSVRCLSCSPSWSGHPARSWRLSLVRPTGTAFVRT